MKHIYFYHMPKTGGMSVAKFLNRLKKQNLIQLYHNGHEKPLPKSKINKPNIIKITFIRDPIEHTKSLYKYIKSSKNHRHHKFAVNRTFSQWIKDCKALKNYYCKFYASGSHKLEDAIKNMSDFDFIGLTHKLDDDMNNLLHNLGLPIKYDKSRINVNRKNDFKITNEHKNLIIKARPDDIKLYKHILNAR